MRSLARNRKKNNARARPRAAAPKIVPLHQLQQHMPAIEAPFLKERVRTYLESAEIMIDRLDQIRQGGAADFIKKDIEAHAKQARLLDMILQVVGASGYLTMQDCVAAQKIRAVIENKLDAYAQRQENGALLVSFPAGNVQVETCSAIGRRVAGFIHKFVPPPAQDVVAVCDPGDIDACLKTGGALIDAGKYDDAVALYQKALLRKLDHPGLGMGIGIAYLMKGEDAKAKASLEHALEHAPNSAELLARLGAYHQIHHEAEAASLYYARALKIAPNHAATLNSYGELLCRQRKTAEGLGLIDRSLRLEPQNVDFLFVKAVALLADGQYDEGWALYEHGLRKRILRNVGLAPGMPVWKGEIARDKKLLIVVEQGLGDAIQFVRYAALCRERVGKILVACPESLRRLFENCPYIDEVSSSPAALKYDLQIPMMSLPHILGTTLDTIPAAMPYLSVPPKVRNKWAGKIPGRDGRLKIGLVWSGGAFKDRMRGDLRAKRRNMELKQLLPLLECENAVFYNLQKGEDAGQIDALGLRGRIVDHMPDVTDMCDTAALIENLDLVITVDTSVAHLAGALGTPVWILSRYDACWRWLRNRPDSPWYPTARIFGQPKSGDWDSVVGSVAEALKDFS